MILDQSVRDYLSGGAVLPVFHFGRTGSTLLQHCLSQSDEVIAAGEIFTNAQNNDDFQFRHPIDFRTVLLGDRSFEAARKVQKKFLFEFKYLNFCEHLQHIALEPVLADFATLLGRKIILLRRRNAVKRIVSVLKAWKTGTYFIKDGQDRSTAAGFELPLTNLQDFGTGACADDFLSLLRKSVLIENAVSAAVISTYPNVLELWYEDDLEYDPSKGIEKVCRFANIKPFDFKIELQRTSTELSADLRNFGALHEILAGSEFEEMLKS